MDDNKKMEMITKVQQMEEMTKTMERLFYVQIFCVCVHVSS